MAIGDERVGHSRLLRWPFRRASPRALTGVGVGAPRRTPAERADRDRKWILLGVLVVWELVVRLGLISTMFAPAPTAVVVGMFGLAADPEIRRAFGDTVVMLFAAFGLAGVGGILIGALLGLSKWAYRVFHPIVVILFSTPKMIFVPLVILIFGIGFTAKVAYASMAAIFPVIVTVVAGVRVIDTRLLTAARSMGATRWQTIRLVVVPGSMPAVFAALWYGIKHALLGVLIMELFVSQRGIGYFIRVYTSGFRSDRVYALLLALSLVAIALATFWRRVEERLSRWRTTGEA